MSLTSSRHSLLFSRFFGCVCSPINSAGNTSVKIDSTWRAPSTVSPTNCRNTTISGRDRVSLTLSLLSLANVPRGFPFCKPAGRSLSLSTTAPPILRRDNNASGSSILLVCSSSLSFPLPLSYAACLVGVLSGYSADSSVSSPSSVFLLFLLVMVRLRRLDGSPQVVSKATSVFGHRRKSYRERMPPPVDTARTFISSQSRGL